MWNGARCVKWIQGVITQNTHVMFFLQLMLPHVDLNNLVVSFMKEL